jgi:hypothetical protein
MCDPIAGASDPFSLRADEALSVDVGIGEEEGASTGADGFLEGFYRMSPLAPVNRNGERGSIDELWGSSVPN